MKDRTPKSRAGKIAYWTVVALVFAVAFWFALHELGTRSHPGPLNQQNP
jgi:hypothetical protein